MRILLGTTNPAKVRMFERWFQGYPVDLVTPAELKIVGEAKEEGRDPRENARLKAEFYGNYAEYVICNDSGLYFAALPLHDSRQPGLHIRTPMGTRLDGEQMIEYYSGLIASLGGKVKAFYLDGYALKTPEGMFTYLDTMEAAEDKAFWMTATPYPARRPGWPLDSLSLMADGVTPFLAKDKPKEMFKLSTDENSNPWLRFILKSLGLEEHRAHGGSDGK